ncbi:hypothetical protein [Streptoalloteichus tenebrarius]|uniref:hypothetical protein n=1 Tax=Streptoalloteichus tenebrarius (strain ATCC 17920 / DSM 40477 / JCM 4838 / CBS 697.72 / NBRC 16177 / NCIMB 11028 / NRRL B-12390 / A12253. 1 / ISP 5477) TaxID=1933 RepID=UPI0020A49D67|nr:hypothetical protein [Streptoalloteichus tenebrarius]BFE99836.1 hypothetical protein GCM10020241_15120 [Streptoalloteichus tenebrarius]
MSLTGEQGWAIEPLLRGIRVIDGMLFSAGTLTAAVARIGWSCRRLVLRWTHQEDSPGLRWARPTDDPSNREIADKGWSSHVVRTQPRGRDVLAVIPERRDQRAA